MTSHREKTPQTQQSKVAMKKKSDEPIMHVTIGPMVRNVAWPQTLAGGGKFGWSCLHRWQWHLDDGVWWIETVWTYPAADPKHGMAWQLREFTELWGQLEDHSNLGYSAEVQFWYCPVYLQNLRMHNWTWVRFGDRGWTLDWTAPNGFGGSGSDSGLVWTVKFNIFICKKLSTSWNAQIGHSSLAGESLTAGA